MIGPESMTDCEKFVASVRGFLELRDKGALNNIGGALREYAGDMLDRYDTAKCILDDAEVRDIEKAARDDVGAGVFNAPFTSAKYLPTPWDITKMYSRVFVYMNQHARRIARLARKTAGA